MKSFLIYKFTCASCSSSYIGETCCYFKTRIEEYIKKDNKSYILNIYTEPQYALTRMILFLLKYLIKLTVHINSRKRNLNAEQNHLAPAFHYSFCPCYSFLLCVCVSLSSIISCCLNDTSLLLYLIRTHLVLHFSYSSIIFIISMLIIGIFYCLNYTLLLLHLIITHLVNIFYNNYVNNICSRQLL